MQIAFQLLFDGASETLAIPFTSGEVGASSFFLDSSMRSETGVLRFGSRRNSARGFPLKVSGGDHDDLFRVKVPAQRRIDLVGRERGNFFLQVGLPGHGPV